MLVLHLSAGGARYALPVRRVVEALPRLELRPVPLAPPEIAGLFSYRGEVVPVVDLSQALARRPCPERLSNRILVVALEPDARGVPSRVGLLVEQLSTEVVEAAAPQQAVALPGAPFLAGVLVAGREIVPLVVPESLLSDELLAVLQPAMDAVGAAGADGAAGAGR